MKWHNFYLLKTRLVEHFVFCLAAIPISRNCSMQANSRNRNNRKVANFKNELSKILLIRDRNINPTIILKKEQKLTMLKKMNRNRNKYLRKDVRCVVKSDI